MRIFASLMGFIMLASFLPAQDITHNWRAASPPPTQIQMQVMVLEIDGTALAESELDLKKIFSGWSGSESSPPQAIVTESISHLEALLLMELLRSTKVSSVLSRPQIVTLENREAQIQVGAQIPLLTVEETVNGKTTQRLETKEVGLLLDLTPSQVTENSLRLTIALTESAYEPEGIDRAGNKGPVLKTRRIETHAKVPLGDTLVVTERVLLAPQKGGEDGKQLLLTVTPRVINRAPSPTQWPAPAPKASTTRSNRHPVSWRPSPTRAAAVVPRHNAQASRAEPLRATPTRPAQPTKNIQQELRLLRESVDDLRGDVSRLIRLLEARHGAKSDPSLRRFLPLNPLERDLSEAAPATARWHSRLGIKVAEFMFPRNELTIVDVDEKGPAADASIRTGDVLVGLDRWETNTHSDLSYALQRCDDQEMDKLKFLIVRGTDTMYGHLQLPPKDPTAGTDEEEPQDDSPEAVVKRMIKGGDSEQMMSLLSAKARQRAARLGLDLGYRNPEEYSLECEPAIYPHPGADTATVTGNLTHRNSTGKTSMTRPTWHLHRDEVEGWKITGVGTSGGILFDFETRPYGQPVTLNPVTPELFERQPDGYQVRPPQATRDKDILRRRNLLVDIDSGQPAGQCATDAEKKSAHAVARKVSRHIQGTLNLPVAIKGDSGNGYHLILPLDTPNDGKYLPVDPKPDTSTGNARTANFIVSAPTFKMAKDIAQQAEQLRSDLAEEWLGRELKPWREPCPVRVLVTDATTSGGATTYTFIDNVPVKFHMEIQGGPATLDDELAHEIMHTILATHLGRPSPRWLDVGIATAVDSDEQRQDCLRLAKQCLQEGKLASVEVLLTSREYPSDPEAMKRLNAQSYCLAKMLVERRDPRTLVDCIQNVLQTTDWPPALKQHYKISDFAELESALKQWISDQEVE